MQVVIWGADQSTTVMTVPLLAVPIDPVAMEAVMQAAEAAGAAAGNAEQAASDAQVAAEGAANDVRAEVAADADRAQAAADALSNSVGTINEIVSADQLAENGGTVLIGYQNGRAAVVQMESGLDFVPSETLRERLVGDLSKVEATSGGMPLIEYRNGRVAIMQMPDGIDFEPSPKLIDRLPIQVPDPLSDIEIEVNSVNGQSHSIGGPWDAVMTFARAMGSVSRSALQLVGTHRSDGAEITNSMGPGQYGYDRAISATGIADAAPGGNQIGLPFAAFALLNAHRADLNLPQRPSLTGAHGIGGIPLSSMTPGSVVWESFAYWTAQAMTQAAASGRQIRRGWHVFNHGGAGKTFPRGQYRAEWIALQKQTMAHFDSIGLPQPRYIITLTGGEVNTANDTPGNWAVSDDQLDLIEMGCAVAGTSDYWYPIYDNQVHWDAHGTALAGETLAWAMAEIEAGRGWSITRPRIVSNTGGALVLSFDSLREDEQLAIEDAAKYNGEGIDAYLGFQVDGAGAALTGIDVTGKRVSLTYSGSPTAIKYARQIQDVSGFAGNRYTAHRGLLRTTLRKPSKFFPDELLVRPIPSFTLALGA